MNGTAGSAVTRVVNGTGGPRGHAQPYGDCPWVPVAPCTPQACTAPPLERVGAARRVLRVAAVVAVLLAGLPVATVAGLAGTAGRIALTGIWSRLLLRALGVRVEVSPGFTYRAGAVTPAHATGTGSGTGTDSGTRAGSGELIVANHVSWLDPVVLAAALPCRLLAKREVRSWPVLGSLAAGSGAIFIDRSSLYRLPEAVGQVAAALRGGHAVAAFPEGTTWCGRGMGSFRPAVFQAAVDAGAPVRPVAVRYVEAGAPAAGAAFVGDDTLAASMARVASYRGLVAEVTLLPHLPAGSGGRGELARMAESAVAPAVAVAAPYLEKVAAGA